MPGSDPHWCLTKDGDRTCLELFQRHYSNYKYKDGRQPKRFCGPGQRVVLRTASGDALFVWRKFKDDCIDQRTGERQQGINCAIFRNESPIRSSLLITQADSIADFIWPDQRHYTYVNPKAIRGSNPGFCFISAGWVRLKQRTKSRGLIILERVNDARK